MSIDLSPKQDRRLHSILDQGMESMRSSLDQSPIQTSFGEVGSYQSSYAGEFQDELQCLQSKLSKIESMITKKASKMSMKTNPSKKVMRKRSSSPMRKSPSFKQTEKNENKPRKPERSITPSQKYSRKSHVEADKEKEKLIKENEDLKKKLKKQEDFTARIIKLQEDYHQLTISFQRSENVRKKQKQIIEELKKQIQDEKTGKRTHVVRVPTVKEKSKR